MNSQTLNTAFLAAIAVMCGVMLWRSERVTVSKSDIQRIESVGYALTRAVNRLNPKKEHLEMSEKMDISEQKLAELWGWDIIPSDELKDPNDAESSEVEKKNFLAHNRKVYKKYGQKYPSDDDVARVASEIEKEMRRRF